MQLVWKTGNISDACALQVVEIRIMVGRTWPSHKFWQIVLFEQMALGAVDSKKRDGDKY